MALALVAMSSHAMAQLPTGQNEGLFVGLFNSAAGTNHMLQIEGTNVGTMSYPFTTAAASAWPYWGNPFGIAQNPNNINLDCPAIIDAAATTIGVASWDPTLTPSGPIGVVSTLWSGPLTGGPIGNWADWEYDSNGDLITIDNSGPTNTPPGPQTAAFISGGVVTTIALPSTVRNEAGIGMTSWDRLNGGFVHCSWGQSGTIGTEVYTSDSKFATNIVRNTSGVFNTRYGGDVDQNGDVWLSTCCAQSYLYAGAISGTIALGPTAMANVCYDLTTEHLAKPGVGLWATIFNAPGGVQHIDVTAGPNSPVFTQTFTGSAITWPSSGCEVMPMYENDLNTQRTGGRTWVANINPGNGAYANFGYVFAASLAGAGQINLSSGREIFLTPDTLTLTLINLGGLAPFFQNASGTLNALGTAQVTMDMTSLGLAANGIVVHLAAVILDPQAPDGIAHVCQPYAWVLDNQ